MATNFSPCKGSYVSNQFPNNVMFGMNGFHVSASGAIQGHYGPLVYCSFANYGTFFLVNKDISAKRHCWLSRFRKRESAEYLLNT